MARLTTSNRMLGALHLLTLALLSLLTLLSLLSLRLYGRTLELRGFDEFRTTLSTALAATEDLALRADIEFRATLVAEEAIGLDITSAFGAFD